MTFYERMDHYTDKSGGPDTCWAWKASKNGIGYGKIYCDGRLLLAHRVVWERTNGPITNGLGVLHRCDNPSCVNPAHLRAGTAKDNVQDMLAKWRGCHGVRQGAAKLTDEKVQAIRRDTRPQHVIAKEYGVAQSNISLIKQGRTWKHLAAENGVRFQADEREAG
jgi:hypothetical protein